MPTEDWMTLQELLDYPMPPFETTPPSNLHQNTRNDKWAKLIEMRGLKSFTPKRVRNMIGKRGLQLETRFTRKQVDDMLRTAMPNYTVKSRSGCFTARDRFFFDREKLFTGFNQEFLKPIVRGMLDVICQFKERPYILWVDTRLNRFNINFDENPNISSLFCDSHVGFHASGEGYKASVVGDDKLSRTWTFESVKPVLGKKVQSLVMGTTNDQRNPVRQVVSYANAANTCWSYILTNEEIVLGRVYKVAETDEVEDFLLDWEEYSMAEDQWLGIEMMSIPWGQKRGPDTMSVLEALLGWSILSFHDGYRELVLKDHLPPLVEVFNAAKAMMRD
ncbi:hypothetical protein F5Y18DRAFT_428085 [Xylariaceae sp. FL1019]|nr:hypothetical protein F5Y18DRAFT_428085 [Xylariaceae sp. FL1019]